MPYKKYPLLKKKNFKSIPLHERQSLVHANDFTYPYVPGSGFAGFLNSLPRFYAAKELLEFCQHVKTARKKGKPIILGLGVETINVGLSPIIIDLMERGWISALAVTGAFMIHDFEIALVGKTSENIAENLHKGRFGNAEETGLFLNVALKDGVKQNMGAGEAVGYYLISSTFPFNSSSVLYKAYKLNIPVTVFPAIGTDFIHYHPTFDGAVVGALAQTDFMLFSSIVSQLTAGGIYINAGSAEILPEVFLKALAFCTLQGIQIKDFYTALFDGTTPSKSGATMVSNPILNGGKGYHFIGHHEILLPFLAAILIEP